MTLSVEESTPRGSGAVSVLRFSGPEAPAAVRDLCGIEPAPGPPRRVDLRIGVEDLDEAILCVLPSGDCEVHVHGSPALVRRLLSHFGAGKAERRGERSLEEAARERLPFAPCEAAARILLDQAEGALSRELSALALESAQARERRIGALLARWGAARRALEPAEIVIVGPVNSGKSTLFNALVGEARAIVAPEPGTTRDRLRARAQLGRWPVWISDTAGERELPRGPAASVEEEGQERARRAAARADLVLRLERLDPLRPRGAASETGERARELRVHTFADLVEPASRPEGAISALSDPSAARRRVSRIFHGVFDLPEEPWTPGDGVPFSPETASAIAALRGRTEEELRREVEALSARGPSAPRPGSVARETRIS